MDERYAAAVQQLETLMQKQQRRREEADIVRCAAVLGRSRIPRNILEYHMPVTTRIPTYSYSHKIHSTACIDCADACRNDLAVFHHLAPVNMTSSSSENRFVGQVHSSVHGLMPLDITADSGFDLANRLWDLM